MTLFFIAEKVRRRTRTGQGFSADIALDELDEVILDIIGKYANVKCASVGPSEAQVWDAYR